MQAGMSRWRVKPRRFPARGETISPPPKNMTFPGNLKTYVVPMLCGVVGTWLYSKIVGPRLPANLQ